MRWTAMAREVTAPFALIRISIVIAAVSAALLLPLTRIQCFACEPTGTWLDALLRWDGRWYLSIAQEGYRAAPGEQSSLSFFPLYPVAIWLVGGLLGGGRIALGLAAIVVSNVALAVGVAYLVALLRLDHDRATALRAAAYLLTYPATIFLSAGYPESLYLALSCGALYHARTGSWSKASILAALGALTRPYGALLLVPLVMEIAATARAGRPIGRRAFWLALIPAALVGWLAYNVAIAGDPLAFLVAMSAWARPTGVPVLSAIREVADRYVAAWLIFALFALNVVCVAVAWRKMRPSSAAYATALLLVVALSGGLTSSMRHELVIFPTFAVLGMAGASRPAHLAYAIVGGTLAVVLATGFALQDWIG